MEVTKRLLKEFWVPALLALGWTVYNLTTNTSSWNLRAWVNVFGPSFFLVSWATGQFFRIRKQALVDKNLKGIEGRLEDLLNNIESRTENLLSHITGGESFCCLDIANLDPATNRGVLCAANKGLHPLYEIHARFADLDYLANLGQPGGPQSLDYPGTNISIGNLISSHSVALRPIELDPVKGLRLNVFFTARNGDFTQILRMARSGDRWYVATMVIRGGQIVFEQIQDGFPVDLTKDVDWAATIKLDRGGIQING